MMWKKFTVSLLCLAACSFAFACAYCPPEIGSMYMFRTYCQIGSYDYLDRDVVREGNVSFWYAYVDGHVDKKSIEDALYNGSKKDVKSGKYSFFSYLRQNNDEDALRYWELTKRFAEFYSDPWYYPSKDDLLELRQLAQQIQSAGNICKDPGLKERYMLQLMRISFYLRDYLLCCDVWENYSGRWLDRDMERRCCSYYAGALYHTGYLVESADHFAELEEWESLGYFDDNVDFMRALYDEIPCSKAFEYFIQNFENHYQDMGKLLDSKAFVGLCEQVLKEKRTDNPALWQSAVAHIAFLDGDVKTAVRLIEKASGMQGTPLVMENVRMLRLLYHAADHDADDYDGKINADLPWMLKKLYDWEGSWSSSCNGEQHCQNMIRRILFHHLLPHYAAQGNFNMEVALLNALDEADCWDKEGRDLARKDKSIEGSFDYETFSFACLDTTSIERVIQFLDFVKSGGKTELEKNLVKVGYVRESMIYELIGTKYMRVHDYETALRYFQKVSSSFWIKLNVTEYLDRNPFEEKWFERPVEKGISSQQYSPAQLYAANPTKIQFCQIMLELKRLAETADVDLRALCHYAYAAGLWQSHEWSWALTQYVSGNNYWDGVFYQSDEDFVDNGWDYLRSVAYARQKLLKEIGMHLDEAERLSGNRELTARCQYLRSYIEPDASCKQQYRRHLANDFTDTRFHRNEMLHCDYLSLYR